MSRDRLDVSRRRLLAGVSGLGAFGFAGGATSAAYLSDRETVSGTQRTGSVGLDVTCDDCVTEEHKTTFALERIEPDERRTERFGLSIEGNPVRVWLRTTCPPAVDPLGEALEVRLHVATDCDGGPRRTLHPSSGWTTLADLRETLVDGVRVDDPTDPCLSAADDPCLEFDYRLPNDAAWAGSATGEFAFELLAEQCRHVPESDATPPFETSTSSSACPDVECETCAELGTIDLDGGRLVPGKRYPLDERNEHELQVLQTTDAVDGDGNRETVCAAVRLLRDADGTGEFEEGAAPPICAITVTGRTDPGQELEPETRTAPHDVVPPLTRTRGKVCTPSDENGGDETRPGIESITISTCADGNGDQNGDNEDGNGDNGDGNGDGDGENGDCVSCGSDSNDRRVGGATFQYDGPAGNSVTVVIDQQSDGNPPQQSNGNPPQQSNGNPPQQSNGNPPQKTVTVEDVAPGDSFTVQIAGRGRSKFEISVRDPNDDKWTRGTIHTRCSQSFGPGTTVGDETRTLTVLEAVTKDGTPICGVNDI
ncbi:hypothetical protein SAMN05192561_103248 [Halopenitus malekzadehii]|uniref:SipW-cognate class signal peptide n=1 Tax=Halopenitus malekzadehii TaxID=1267564 RepID=A0A1H6ILW6_9EURY|nr:hypothetical protein [Halopenitus malekzadehii]SEH50599.1 hypothetical protein SAMN05192561_103248 [Halopenitus malekzadehii]